MLIGTTETTAGTLASPLGQWRVASTMNLNSTALDGLGNPIFPHDGIRHIFATAENLAGEVSLPPASYDIFLDTQGPRVTDVHITNIPTATYNLFGLKPGNAPQGPTPLIYGLTINIADAPIAIRSSAANWPSCNILPRPPAITCCKATPAASSPSRASPCCNGTAMLTGRSAQYHVELRHALPDDRFTLTINDSLRDPAQNSWTARATPPSPTGAAFPSGDGQPGGDFVARFTVDSRPEIGTWSGGSVYVYTNGNFSFDPTNTDYTNRDFAYTLGYTSDDFSPATSAPPTGRRPDGFSKLAAYGRVGNAVPLPVHQRRRRGQHVLQVTRPQRPQRGQRLAGCRQLRRQRGQRRRGRPVRRQQLVLGHQQRRRAATRSTRSSRA